MDPTVQRLKYLNHAAHALTLSSPAIAAQFQARYDHVANEKDVDLPDSRARQICCACGYNMLSSAEYTVTPQSKSRRKQQKRVQNAGTKGDRRADDKAVILECSACLSRTEMKLPAARRSNPSSGRTGYTAPVSSTPTSITSRAALTPGLATQNSRAKASRAKNRNSLHAMLAKSKEEAQSGKGFGFGLGLMDLMKGA